MKPKRLPQGFFRPWHLVRPNRASWLPSRIVCVDTEARSEPDPEEPTARKLTFRLGSATYDRLRKGAAGTPVWVHFTDTRHFWTWLLERLDDRHTTYVWAHNLVYDLTQLGFWSLLDSGRFRVVESEAEHAGRCQTEGKKLKRRTGLLCIDDPPSIIRGWLLGKPVTFLDSTNWLRLPLAEIGHWVGIPKGAWPGNDSDPTTLAFYCANDVSILRAAVLKLLILVRYHDLGSFATTIASQAERAYRHRHLYPGLAVHGSEEVTDLERAAYYGGECRAYFKGEVIDPQLWMGRETESRLRGGRGAEMGPIHHLDLTGAYPAAMVTGPYPVSLYHVERNCAPEVLREALASYAVIARVTLDSSQWYPARDDRGGLIWRLGTFETALAGPELHHALKSGHVRSCSLAAIYREGEVFRSYVECFWRMRRQAELARDRVTAHLAKTLLVSLHGKLAQRGGGWVDRPELSVPQMGRWGPFLYINKDGLHKARAVAGHAQVWQEGGESPHSLPALAAYVASAVRLRMRLLRGVAGTREVYYQDTDSLHVTSLGRSSLERAGQVHVDQLGMLRVVGTHQSAVYYGPKHYVLDGILHHAGGRCPAPVTANGVYQVERWDRAETLIRRQPDGVVRVRTVPIRGDAFASGDDYGPDGWLQGL